MNVCSRCTHKFVCAHRKLFDECVACNHFVPDTNVGKWIPVTEGLPCVGEIVLALGKRHATSGQFRGAGSKPNLWLWRGNVIKDVTHWMHLPQPPKEE